MILFPYYNIIIFVFKLLIQIRKIIMEIRNAIRKAKGIVEGKPQLFIAEENFSYQGLPILKDSLVLYDGVGKVDVNMIYFGIFQDSNVPVILDQILEPKNSLLKKLGKVSDCPQEMDEIDLLDTGIWHRDHFDEWNNSFAEFLPRIQSGVKLEYNGTVFSSLMYSFNSAVGLLTNFINLEPLDVDVNGNKLALPPMLEIVFPNVPKKDETLYPSAIQPIGEMEYFGYNLRGKLGIDKEGAVFGESAEEFEAKVYEHPKFETITMTVGANIVILPDGTAGIRLKDQKHKVHHFKIERL